LLHHAVKKCILSPFSGIHYSFFRFFFPKSVVAKSKFQFLSMQWLKPCFERLSHEMFSHNTFLWYCWSFLNDYGLSDQTFIREGCAWIAKILPIPSLFFMHDHQHCYLSSLKATTYMIKIAFHNQTNFK
jgi:hypothetical protein